MAKEKKGTLLERRARVHKIGVATLAGLKGDKAQDEALKALAQESGPIERETPEVRRVEIKPPKPRSFPVRADWIELKAFSNTELEDVVDPVTGLVTTQGLEGQVTEWLKASTTDPVTGESTELQVLDWEFLIAPDGAYKFLLIYTE